MERVLVIMVAAVVGSLVYKHFGSEAAYVARSLVRVAL